VSKPLIILAGATGNLGERLAYALRERDAPVRAIVRRDAAPDKLERLRALGASIAAVDLGNMSELTAACLGGSCVVSALSGLHDVVVEKQTMLLDAAVQSGVPRFIPSDFSIDFTRLPPGSNRNLDLRREFHRRLGQRPIAATSVFNGAFADMLTGQAPLVLFKAKRVLYFGDADQRMDFTTMDDTAAYTAAAALDRSTPRVLRIAGDQVSARDLAAAASEATGTEFRLLRAGSLAMLERVIKITRAVLPGRKAIYPPWQGMQYMHNIFSGLAEPGALDNDRYPGIDWTTARQVLAAAHHSA
jgi:nucleoside-diphosphate-sugar epimerase